MTRQARLACLVGVLSLSAVRLAAAQGYHFPFDVDGVLPSAQLATYVSGGPADGPGGPPESAVYSVAGGHLYQNTLGLGPVSAYYLLNGTFDHRFDAVWEWRVQVVRNEAKAVNVHLHTPENESWTFNIAEQGVETVSATTLDWVMAVPMNTTDGFHTYRVVIPANTTSYDLYVDGELRYTGVTFQAPARQTDFGDTTPSGGNAMAVWDYITLHNPVVRYEVCAVYDQARAVRVGSTLPVKIQLCDASGANLSSDAIAVTAVSIIRVSASAPGPIDDSGNANPDSNFRYDPEIGGTGGYIFNLKTTGFVTGTYQLNLRAGDDQVLHAVFFQVR